MGFGICGNGFLRLMLTAAALCGWGCATAPSPAGSSTAPTATVERMYDDYSQAELQIEATQDALHELRTTPVEDIEQAADALCDLVLNLRETGQRLVAHADGIYLNGASYFVEAEKTGAICVYPRGAAAAMMPAQLGPFLDPISEASWEIKHAYRAYEFDVTSITENVCCNPTPRAVITLLFIFNKADVDSASLEDALERALAYLQQAKTAKAQAAQLKPGP